VLRACADPNNLPFSDSAGTGFENRLAALVAGELHARLEYAWWAQRRGFVRNTLNEGLCDVLLGVPAGFGRAATTEPYYRSTYVFVWPKAKHYDIHSFDDPRLRELRVGVQLIGDDYANTPPAHALGKRGLARNVVGFPVYGDYATDAPLSPILDAVVDGKVDVALVWGPLAGWYARQKGAPLRIAPVSPAQDPPFSFAFDMAMGVRKGNEALRSQLDQVIATHRRDLDAILARFGVPR
jgi:mxaJ protein